MGLGRRIEYFRNKAGLTIDDLANLTGLSKSHIAAIEEGKRKASVRTLAIIAYSLGVSISGLKTSCKEEEK